MKIFKIFTAIFCAFSVVFSVCFANGKINEDKRLEEEKITSNILTIWQIDTFEGGTKSRRQFLTDVAKDFERQNQGVLIMVNSHTIESAENSFKSGIFPDIISYGNGLELKEVTELKADITFKGGVIEEKNYAVPWCRGGYFLIANPKKVKSIEDKIQNLIVSQSEFTLPTLALYKEGLLAEKISVYKPLDAYVNFVSGNGEWLLGTQRDLERLSRRGMEVLVKPILEYNDLYQYVSILSKGEKNIEYAEKFINLLLSEKYQKKLTDIKMMSAFYEIGYSSPILESEKKINFLTVPIYVEKQKIKEIQKELEFNIKPNESTNLKINKVLI